MTCPTTPAKGKPCVLFFGFVYPADMQEFVVDNERGFPQFAANKLGWHFIHGIEHGLEREIDILSVLAVSAYPRFSKLIIAPSPRRRADGAELRFVPFLNIPLVKRFFIFAFSTVLLARWLWLTRAVPDRKVFLYAMYLPTLVASLACRVCRVPCVLAVPDLPEYMRPGHVPTLVMGFFQRLNSRLTYAVAHCMSGYVFLTKYMAARFNLKDKPFTVVEGCVDDHAALTESAREDDRQCRTVFYAGGLQTAYGVGMLLEAFRRLEAPDLRLWLCGRGELEPQICEAAKRDSRITYFGALPNDRVVELAERATILVNPRYSRDEFTQYSFPSKTLEYLATGRPVVMCALPGIPDEYFGYVYVLEDTSIDGLATLLKRLLEQPSEQLEAFGRRGREFVLSRKNVRVQGEKVLAVLNAT
jgi:glycosyltransferase involved in cell wall biosynthesis